ncbi:MAG: glycosyltransferase family 39 protein [Acidobacteriota bacterium]
MRGLRKDSPRRVLSGAARRRRAAVFAVWIAFLARGAIQALVTPIWEGFDEPFHVAYVTFVARNGRPPGYEERSYPVEYRRILRILPSWLGSGIPTFRQWQQLKPDERAARRSLAGRPGSAMGSPPQYESANYERQQPPLFYYLAAPFAWILSRSSLAELIVGLRLFCVLIASLAVPATARLARLLLPQRGVLLALPIAAFLPNTLFFVDRVTNDALAWPILAAAAGTLVLAARRPGDWRRFLRLGLLVAAGVWTKMTLLPLLPAALTAALLARRRRDGRRRANLVASAGLPALLIAPLLAWNVAAAGTWTGITYSIHGRHPGIAAALAEWKDVDWPLFLRYWTRTHLWAGGWEFLQPAEPVYAAAAAALVLAVAAALARARRRRRALPGRSRWLPLGLVALLFLGAMLFHVLSVSAAGHAAGTPQIAGGEGWYFDLLRPIEACAAAALLCAALPARRTRSAVAAVVLLLGAVDAAGTFGLLLPHWAGMPTTGWSPRALRFALGGARQAAPLLYPYALAGALGVILFAACLALVLIAPPARAASGATAA